MDLLARTLSIISIIISFSQLIFNIVIYIISHAKIKVFFNLNRCMVINEIIPSGDLLRPFKAIILSVRLINKSDKDIYISKIQIKHEVNHLTIFSENLNKKINYDFQYADIEYGEIIPITDKQIKLPCHLKSHEEVNGYIVFPYVYEEIIKDYQYNKLITFYTSRGDFSKKCYIKSQDEIYNEYLAKY